MTREEFDQAAEILTQIDNLKGDEKDILDGIDALFRDMFGDKNPYPEMQALLIGKVIDCIGSRLQPLRVRFEEI